MKNPKRALLSLYPGLADDRIVSGSNLTAEQIQVEAVFEPGQLEEFLVWSHSRPGSHRAWTYAAQLLEGVWPSH